MTRTPAHQQETAERRAVGVDKCWRCSGKGTFIVIRDPEDPASEMDFRHCDECGGTGRR